MEIDNLEIRRSFWGDVIKTNPVWDKASPTKYLDENRHLFKDKSVLEIGPGNGRQFYTIYPLTKAYVIADISRTVLENKLFEHIPKWQICEYNTWEHEKAEITHFWYVLHHVKLNELSAFFKFIHSTLIDEGIAFFNFPLFKRVEVADNGMKTTPMNEKHIFNSIDGIFDIDEYIPGQPFDKHDQEEMQGTCILRKI